MVVDGAGKVQVSYTTSAWGDDLSESAGLVDDHFAVVLGARYLFAPAHLGVCRVDYQLPAGWDIHHPSGARRIGEDVSAWEYPSYEILLDTPVVMGHFEKIQHDVHGTPFWFVFVDRGVGFKAEVERFVTTVASTVSAFHEIFGPFPFEDYTLAGARIQ